MGERLELVPTRAKSKELRPESKLTFVASVPVSRASNLNSLPSHLNSLPSYLNSLRSHLNSHRSYLNSVLSGLVSIESAPVFLQV